MKSTDTEFDERTEEIIPLLSSTEVIRSLGSSPSPEVKRMMIRHIEAQGEVVADDLRTRYRRQHLEAVAGLNQVQHRIGRAKLPLECRKLASALSVERRRSTDRGAGRPAAMPPSASRGRNRRPWRPRRIPSISFSRAFFRFTGGAVSATTFG